MHDAPAKVKLSMHFLKNVLLYLFFDWDKNLFRPSMPESDTFHVMLSAHWHPNLSGIIQNPNSVFLPAGGHENGATTRRRRAKFLSAV